MYEELRMYCIVVMLRLEALIIHLLTQSLLSEAARCVPFRNRAQSAPVRNHMSSYEWIILSRRTSSVC